MSPHSHGQEDRRWTLPLQEHPLLEVDADFATLAVVPAASADDCFVECESNAAFPIDVRANGGTTRVRIGGPGASCDDDSWWQERWWDPSFWERHPWKRRGRSQITLHVPASVRGRIHSSAGRARVERLRGCELTLAADAGLLTVHDVSGKLTLATQAGRIDGRGLRGTLDASTSAGAVRLEILSLDPGTHRIRTNMGAVKLDLAEGMPVRIETRTTMGSARVEVPSSPDAAAILEVSADLGAIKIRPSHHRFSAEPATDDRARSAASPYRTPSVATADEVEVEQVLQRVAAGSISPADARELLRAMGWF